MPLRFRRSPAGRRRRSTRAGWSTAGRRRRSPAHRRRAIRTRGVAAPESDDFRPTGSRPSTAPPKTAPNTASKPASSSARFTRVSRAAQYSSVRERGQPWPTPRRIRPGRWPIRLLPRPAAGPPVRPRRPPGPHRGAGPGRSPPVAVHPSAQHHPAEREHRRGGGEQRGHHGPVLLQRGAAGQFQQVDRGGLGGRRCRGPASLAPGRRTRTARLPRARPPALLRRPVWPPASRRTGRAASPKPVAAYRCRTARACRRS